MGANASSNLAPTLSCCRDTKALAYAQPTFAQKSTLQLQETVASAVVCLVICYSSSVGPSYCMRRVGELLTATYDLYVDSLYLCCTMYRCPYTAHPDFFIQH